MTEDLARKVGWAETINRLNEETPMRFNIYYSATMLAATVVGKYFLDFIMYLDRLTRN